MTNTDVALRQPGRRDITKRARGEFDPGQMDLIRSTVAKDCNPAELAMFLELCANYQLDPFAKQIWAMKIRGSVVTVVSRDGLLALANRHTPVEGFAGPGEFLGCESDVVRANDFFRKSRGPHGTIIDHEYQDAEGKPTASKEKRGPILGSWALVHRREHMPTYFFAEWATYNTGQNVWKSHPETMMVKAAESMALRKAFSVSGVIGEAETPRVSVTAVDTGPGSEQLEWGDDPELADELRQAFEVLGYRQAKVRLLLADKTDEERRALLTQLHAEADSVPDDPEPPIVDAEVVPS